MPEKVSSRTGGSGTDRVSKRPNRTRNRSATREKLIQAVGTLLTREGFKGLGVNAVAKEAGVDKVLIYRYFGGLPELLAAYGREGDIWPSVEYLMGADPEAFRRMAPSVRAALVAVRYIGAIQRRPVTRELLAWEMTERNDLTAAFGELRETRTRELIERLELTEEEGADAEAVLALILGAVEYLVTLSRAPPSLSPRRYAGIDLSSLSGWKRVVDAIELIFDRTMEVKGQSEERSP